MSCSSQPTSATRSWEWQATLFRSTSCDGFRVARPLRARDGTFVVGGWCAWQAVSGRHVDQRWPDIIAVALPAEEFAHVEHLARLNAALQPVAAASQLIHGDLTGNVLFDDRPPPAIIDLSPYWRPTPFASAIAVADALVWEAADESIIGAVAHVDDFAQYLLRALIYRAVADHVRRPGMAGPDGRDPYLPVVELACRLAASP